MSVLWPDQVAPASQSCFARQGLHHVFGIDLVRTQSVNIEFHAHRVGAVPEDGCLSDAGNSF